MASISIYGNQLLLSAIFTKDTASFPIPSSFSVALLNSVPDRNAVSTSLVEPPLTVDGSTSISSGNYYTGTLAGLPGGTFLNYFLSSPMSYSFSDGQSVTITNTASGYNTTGIVKNTVLTNTNTVSAWVAGVSAYSIDDVATYNGAYYVNLTGTNGTGANHPDVDNTNWEFLPFCNYSQFTIYVAATVSTTFTGATGTVVANTGYSRKTINTGSDWTAGQSSVYNTSVIEWPIAYVDWGSIVGWALLDNQATPNIIASGELQQILLVNQNSLVSLPAGSLRLFLN
jgi:hypothetical protein